MIVYLNGSYLPLAEASISPDDRGFLFADGVYEVIYAYGGFLFRADSHWRRLQRSLDELHIEGCDQLDFEAIANELVRQNRLGDTDAYIYLQVTRGAAPRNHAFPQGAEATVYGFARPMQKISGLQQTGCRVITAPDQRWLRCDIKSISLLPNILAKELAVKGNVFETVLVRDGNITEGSSAAFAAVFDNQLVTAPQSNLILPSITREVMLELCQRLGIQVAEEFILAASIHGAHEAMILSTTTEVMPVIEIDGQPVGEGKPGRITRKLQEAFRQMVSHDKAIGS
jgi:D-alanine transaminase